MKLPSGVQAQVQRHLLGVLMRGLVPAVAGLLLCSACATTRNHQSNAGPTITVEASLKRTEHLIAAYDEVQSILEDPGFAENLKKLDGYPLATSADTDCRTTTASEVLTALRSRLPTHRLESRYSLFHPFSTAATTVCASTSVNTRRIDFWEQTNPRQRGTLINTLAHEMTHLLPGGETACSSASNGAYTDAGHDACAADAAQCNDAFLVSYVWGDLVECAYREKQGVIPKGEFHSCFLGLVNSSDVSRTTLTPAFKQPSDACKNIKKWSAETP
ncbi:hypothetical protein [Corallococcus carmarthensis]|uniref:hypothetical protein n=1 Tax=Corallococcus carmarthensis TaxID=2316728 RepID=UPI0011C3E34F|nr:hypothetical protein [Corallococcus carmarthensis]